MREKLVKSLTEQAEGYKKQLEAALQAQENMSRRIEQLRGAIAAIEAVQLPEEAKEEVTSGQEG